MRFFGLSHGLAALSLLSRGTVDALTLDPTSQGTFYRLRTLRHDPPRH